MMYKSMQQSDSCWIVRGRWIAKVRLVSNSSAEPEPFTKIAVRGYKHALYAPLSCSGSSRKRATTRTSAHVTTNIHWNSQPVGNVWIGWMVVVFVGDPLPYEYITTVYLT